MPQPIDLRPEIGKLRQKLEKRTTHQKFLSLEEWIAPLKVKFIRQLIKPEQGRLWLSAMGRVFAGLYVHLPFKQTRYAANPAESLKALERNLPLPPADFNQALLGIFRELRDAHTQYQLPPPYAASNAFLPFEIAAGYDRDNDPDKNFSHSFFVTYVAQQLAPQLKAAGFEPGTRVTHWNGMPIEEAVHQLALKATGANDDARFAGTMRNLTLRPLHRLPIPESPMVTLRFDPPPSKDSKEFTAPAGSEVTFEWSVRKAKPGESVESLQSLLWDLKDEGWQEWPLLDMKAVAYQVRTFAHPTAAEPVSVGLIRLRSFPADTESFVRTFCELIEEMQRIAPLALIIDVRGNSGGSISAAERLLQLLTPGRITPVSFQFRNTPLLQTIIGQDARERERRTEFGLDTDEGTVFSRSACLTTEEEANNIGQRYYGRVALITDALCFSAGDIFAAGFQDHRIGPVIGVHASTGAGGANRWDYNTNVVGKKTEDGWTFPPLPEGANMLFSVRHCLRTGRFQGKVLEDFGVEPDYPYLIKKEDLFQYDTGLYEEAFFRLLWGTGLKEISVDLQVTKLPTDFKDDESLRIDYQTAGVVHAELLVNGQTLKVMTLRPDGSRRSDVNLRDWGTQQVETIELRCYNIMPAKLFPFLPDKERGPDVGKNTLRHVASRTFTKESDSLREIARPQFPRGYPAPRDRRRRILYYVRGLGRKSAREALAIVSELRSLCPDAEVRFASHGTGAKILREHGNEVIDLELPDRPPLFAVQEQLAERVKALAPKFRPLILVSHEEPDLARLTGKEQEPDWPCPCVLIVSHLEDVRPDWHRETLVLSDDGVDLIGRIRPVGPILRPLRYQRQDKARARQELRLPAKDLVISVMVAPGSDGELEAPVYTVVKDAFDRLPQKRKHLLWDPAAGVQEGPFFEAADYDLVMAASDLVIAKGDPTLIAELGLLGTPHIMLYHLEHDLPLCVPDGPVPMLPYTYLDSTVLMHQMRLALDSPSAFEPATIPPERQNGARTAAVRLKELLLDIESFGDHDILAWSRRLAEKKISIGEFECWFYAHHEWRRAKESPLAEAVHAILSQRTAPEGHLDAKAARELAQVIRAFKG